MSTDSSSVDIHLVTQANAHLLDTVDDDVFDHDVQLELLHSLLNNSMNHLAVAVGEGTASSRLT